MKSSYTEKDSPTSYTKRFHTYTLS